jgi:hypothetical protein
MIIQPQPVTTEIYLNLFGSQITEKNPVLCIVNDVHPGIMNYLHCHYFFDALLLEPGKS